MFFRILLLNVLVFCLLPATSLAHEALKLYKAKNYEKAIEVISLKKSNGLKLSFKEHVVLIKSHQKLSNTNLYLSTLRQATRLFPKKDVLKRELSRALEEESESFKNQKIYARLEASLRSNKDKKSEKKEGVSDEAYIKEALSKTAKVSLKKEAMDTLYDLYIKSPTKENFTALIKFYERQKNHQEALALLELYGEKRRKGRIYYSYLCKIQYEARLFSSALETCERLINRHPNEETGHLYHSKSLKAMGQTELAQKRVVQLKGRFPASGSLQFEIGKSLISEGKIEEGLSHLQKHIEIESSDEALVLKAEALFDLGEYEKSLKAFVAACKQHKEPRRPLFLKMRKVASKISRSLPIRKRFDQEIKSCKYTYRVRKKGPRGLPRNFTMK